MKTFLYHGEQDRESTQKLYYNSHIFVSSTQSETQGVVFLEAIASGLPIIKLHSKTVEGVTKQQQECNTCSNECSFQKSLPKRL